MTASAQGADTSAYQQPLTAAVLKADGLSFAFAKAANGTAGEDPDFAVSWQAIAEAGLHRGAYHELTGEDPLLQAGTFMAVVAGRGLKAGDMLAVVASDYAVAGRQAKAFLDAVKAAAGPECPVLLYSDLSALPSLAECSGYPLWLAYYADSAPASVAPWDRWTFWQYQAGGGADGGDRDAFNGTVAELDAWIASYAHPEPPADWTFGPVRDLTVEGAGPHSVKLAWESPAVPMPAAVGHYQIVVRKDAQDVGSYPRVTPTGASPETWQGGSLQPGTAYEALVRAVARDGGHASPWAAAAFTTASA